MIEVGDISSYQCSIKFTHEDAENTMAKLMGLNFSLYCDDCGEFMFECDNKIADDIILINKKGYQTLYCCEGHYEDDKNGTVFPSELVSVPYLNMMINQLSYAEGKINNRFSSMKHHVESAVNIVFANNPGYSDIIKIFKSRLGQYSYFASIRFTIEVENENDTDEKIIQCVKDKQVIFLDFIHQFAEALTDISEKE
jgi:hypothetical protein